MFQKTISSLLLLTIGAVLISLSACGSKEVTPYVRFTPVIGERDQVSDPANFARQAFDTSAGGGLVHIVWEQARTLGGNVYDIWYSAAPATAAAGTFTANAERITDTAEDSRNPRLAVAPNGDVLVVWEEGTSPQREIAFTRRSGGNFSAISTLTNAASNEDDASADVYFDANNHAHFVWVSAGKVMYRRQDANSTFGNAQELPDSDSSGTATNPANPSVVVDSAGNVMVVWQAQQVIGSNNISLIRVAASEDNGTTFGLRGRVGGTSLTQGSTMPSIGLSAHTGGFYMAFLIGKPGGNDFRVRVQRLINFGAESEGRFIDCYTSSSVAADSVDLSTIGDDVFVTYEVEGEGFVRVSVDDLQSLGDAVKIADGNGVAGTQVGPRVAAVGGTMITVVDADTAEERSGFIAISDISTRNEGN